MPMLSLLIVFGVFVIWSGQAFADEGEGPVPELLQMQSGAKVSSVEMWRKKRRPELLELFRQHVYGRNPVERPAEMTFKIEDESRAVMEGKATRKLVTIAYAGPGGRGKIKLVLFIPNQKPKPVPAFLFIDINKTSNIDATLQGKPSKWPVEEIVARGYAAAAFHVYDVDLDQHDGFKDGVHGIFDKPHAPRPADAWGTIAAWAWGASRVMDYLETDASIDPQRIAVVGHSRGGKTALWCGAQDERFAMVVSNNSGCTGAAITRGKKGERIEQITKNFPHWFCQNYTRYSGKEEQLPVEQHMLLALVAPRLLYVASATEDEWADPASEFKATVLASSTWTLWDRQGLETSVMPKHTIPLQKGYVGYHLREGKHALTLYDWERYLDFADKHMAK